MNDDAALLRRYAEQGDQAAFAALVERHVALVFHAARRQLGGDRHRAADVTQAVFTALARKAGRVARQPALAGWLYTSTRYAAVQIIRSEQRRTARERLAHVMNENSSSEKPANWEQLRPALDDALHALTERERDALVLRFFAGRGFAEIGAVLAVSEDAARMRVERALEKLRGTLARRGITSTASALGVLLTEEATAAVPAGLAAHVSSAALAGAVAAPGALAASGFALFAMTKIEIGIATAALAAIAIVGGRDGWAHRAAAAETFDLRGQIASLPTERAENARLARATAALAPDGAAAAELNGLRVRLTQLQTRPPWVAEAKMKSVASARNAGWASAGAALETFLHAAALGDRALLSENFGWVGEAKAQADAAFAQLSPAVREKYGNADRLAGSAWFGAQPPGIADHTWSSRGAAPVFSAPVADDPIVGYWADEDPEAARARPGTMLRMRGWARHASGAERPLVVDLAWAGGRWTLGSARFSPEGWQQFTSRIDPQTGEVLPAKP